jgi:hypothetical protein
MVEGGPIDVLTGDWLAELTMLILARDRAKNPAGGFARTFVSQMEQVMGACLERGIKVVANAGGLNPAGCADAVRTLAARLGLDPVVAHITGDDLLPRLGDLQNAGYELANVDTGEPFGTRQAVAANAYLGCWGIVEALGREADIVIAGRTTDAALVMGPAAWHFGWNATDWDKLAGACVAGHIVECGCQATGGNYPFFREIPGLEHPGFPIAEISPDGACVITKHEGTGGRVDVGTVTAQLLYEIGSPRYVNADVVARFDTVRVEELGPDRVRVHGARGEPAPSELKVSINYVGGYRNSFTFMLTGLDIEAKAELVERTVWAGFPQGRDTFDYAEATLARRDKPDPSRNEEGVAELTLSVKDSDPDKIGRRFTGVAIEMALASYPGLFPRDAPREAAPYGVHWPALLPAVLCPQAVVIDGDSSTVLTAPHAESSDPGSASQPQFPPAPVGSTVRIPLGLLVGARSGDKGGNANLGVWTRTPEAYGWLREFLTLDRLAALFPEAREHPVERFELPNLLALNFVFQGLLGEGVAASTRFDPQAKGLGEYLRARMVDIPRTLLSPGQVAMTPGNP